ncbi:hypothetical protein TKK_0017916 [Trichogramma kaykai]|uniref:MalT-like TPR region domain-containing protein n=1 Tax=Trichogramma kaykai TaxID=54128 RepID=A0ABD2W0S1_9HYME
MMSHKLVAFVRTSLTAFNASKTLLGAERNFANLRCLCSNDVVSDRKYFHGGYRQSFGQNKRPAVLLATSLAFLGLFESKKEEESDEAALISAIKRSILMIQKNEFKKAEQMLHLALRQAQTLQSEDGITYVYDVMANLAFKVGEYDKAQRLFRSVMQREIAKGTPQDDIKIVHMSMKMAKILELKGDSDNAETGYQWCMKILQDYVDKGTEDIEILTLWAMNLDFLAHLLLSMSRYTEAMKYMEKAYVQCVKLNGEEHEQSVVLLNDLGSISFLKGNLDDAIDYLNKAIEIGEKLPAMESLASIYVNLGNVQLKKGLLDEAKRCCAKGWRLAKKLKDQESVEEAKTCLDEVEKLFTK